MESKLFESTEMKYPKKTYLVELYGYLTMFMFIFHVIWTYLFIFDQSKNWIEDKGNNDIKYEYFFILDVLVFIYFVISN